MAGEDQNIQVAGQAANAGEPGAKPQIVRGQGAAINRAAPLQIYERELSNALRWARTIASLHAVSRFMAFCNLTWGSVVLLSAFASYLHLLDFAFIACLLLLESARLASASFFIRLPSRCFAHLSQDPKLINHSKDGRYPAAHHARICSQILQFLLIFPSFVILSIRIFLLDFDPKIRNMKNSLLVFYSLVAFNSLVALVNLMCSAVAYVSLNKPPEQSILRYYDKVLQDAMSFGVVQADDFEFFSFAYTMLGSEYSRNVQPEAVAKNYKQLIQYMYVHRLGMDALHIYLDAKDVLVQLAAVNMVGFWADTVWGVGLHEVKFPEELLTKLADKVGTGQVGWAATSSFGVLAQKPNGACLVARTRTSGGLSLPDRLADMVDTSSSRSLSLVRTLAIFYEQLCINEKQIPKPFNWKVERNLVQKLKKLSKEAKVHRLRVQAAYLLLMMGEDCDPSIIVAIDPTQDTYWFQSELTMLHLLCKHIPYDHVSALQFQHLAIRKDTNITPPPWAQPLSP